MHSVILLTGGNKGDRVNRLAQAKDRIGTAIGRVTDASALYETAAWGNVDQPSFLNQVLRVETRLAPLEVLEGVLRIETDLGRVRMEKWGAREIDIDILFYDAEIINQPELIIPHPEIPNRRFVLEPLAEIAPGLVHPVLRVDVATLLRQTGDQLPVTRLRPSPGTM